MHNRTGLIALSENPALLMRHIYTHPWFGNKTVSAEEDARFIAAGNVCDTPHDYVVDGVTTTRALYTAALVMPYGSPAKDALDSLASAMAGSWAYHRGQIFVRAGAYTAPVMTLTEADLAVEVRQSGGEQVEQQAISVTVHRARVDKFNVVNMRIWDAAQDYKEAALTPLKATALIARDGSELPREMELSCVTYAPQALHVAGVLMRDATPCYYAYRLVMGTHTQTGLIAAASVVALSSQPSIAGTLAPGTTGKTLKPLAAQASAADSLSSDTVRPPRRAGA